MSKIKLTNGFGLSVTPAAAVMWCGLLSRGVWMPIVCAFVHELGHLLHMRATGTITDIPACFIDYLSQLGTDCSELTTAQLQEFFADTFMLAVISQTSAASDPLPQIAAEVKQKCFQYIDQLLRAIPNA